MWKKEEATPTPPQHEEETTPRKSAGAGAGRTAGERATIGPSITVRGEVGGDEDLLIRGTVEGSVTLEQNAITVGREGRVTANITGRIVVVEGRVEGDLTAREQLILRSSAQVQGDITAPRVVLEDGASFRGMVDMGEPLGEGDGSAGVSRDEAAARRADPSGVGRTGRSPGGRPGSSIDDRSGSGSSTRDRSGAGSSAPESGPGAGSSTPDPSGPDAGLPLGPMGASSTPRAGSERAERAAR